MRISRPSLAPLEVGNVRVWHDSRLLAEQGVVVGFSERVGGVSPAPFDSLNLAAHVGDDPRAVDENRSRFLHALDLESLRASLVVPEQVHGSGIVVVGKGEEGMGAFAAHGRGQIPATDALITAAKGIPLLLCFADCVPVVLVAPGPIVAVVHAGWRGALASLPGIVTRRLAAASGCDITEVVAYIGPHVRACHYEVGDEVMSHFINAFGTFARAASGGLDLDVAVTASLTDAGVAQCNIARLGTCTAEATDRFFSFRAEYGRTGRHAALACILPFS